jgi:hypothetical protein
LTAASLRAARCHDELNPPWHPIGLFDLLKLIRQWEAVNGPTAGAIGWDRQVPPGCARCSGAGYLYGFSGVWPCPDCSASTVDPVDDDEECDIPC